MTLSVVIPTYNRADLLTRCLESLMKQEAMPDGVEIIVVDNRSTDHTKETVHDFMARYPEHNVHYVYEPTVGSSIARNTGYKAAGGDVGNQIINTIYRSAKQVACHRRLKMR